jgi:hypothetical protein
MYCIFPRKPIIDHLSPSAHQMKAEASPENQCLAFGERHNSTFSTITDGWTLISMNAHQIRALLRWSLA